MPVRNRPRLVASTSSTTKLFVDDLREVGALARDEKKYRSDVIRELVHEALRLRRLRALGRDESESQVRKLYQEAVAETVAPLINEFVGLRQHMANASVHSKESVTPMQTAKPDDARWELLTYLLHRATVTESMVKVLMTIGMQKDGVSSEEIRKQLAAQDATGKQQAHELILGLAGEPFRANVSERK